MDRHGEEPDRNAATAADSQEQAQGPSPRYKPCNDATGRVLPITPEEQARNARAIAALVERMLAMPDEDPPGAWEEAMRDLDTHRPHRKLFEGMYFDADAILAGQAAFAGQPGDIVTIATTNLAHLSRFPGIDAQTWDQIR